MRGIWFLPSGAFFVATHRGSQVWYVDTAGYIHVFSMATALARTLVTAHGSTILPRARVSECRAVTLGFDGNLLITENDIGYVRKVRFLPH